MHTPPSWSPEQIRESIRPRCIQEPVAASDTNAVLLVNAQMEAYNEAAAPCSGYYLVER